jgi:site-specific DNA recombinase
MTPDTKTKYFIYARKSSESDEKQVQSIPDQVLIMEGISKSYGFKVVDTISESKSAKEPHGRVEFEKMIERLKAGEAQGILVWKIDRLSRNPIDSATIQWLLQKEVIVSIRTPDREYRPEDNALLLSVESSMANQYIRDLSKNVKRGLKSKVDKGWMPSTAPLGYLNTKTEIRGENYIFKDPERFPLLRKAWDLMLTGSYVPQQILNILNNEWGFRTRKSKKKGGKPMSRSTIYRMFTNQFYAGIIPYKGLFVDGKHDAMITIDEFDRVQFLLGRKGKPRPNRYEYAYTGLVACGECGGFMSATFKEKLLKKTRELQSYYLYYCTCAREKDTTCLQKHYTNVDRMEERIEIEIDSLAILPEFKDWALRIIAEKHEEEVADRTTIYESQQRTLNETQKQIDNLTQMRLKEMIDDDEYLREKTRLKNEMVTMQAKMKGTEQRAVNWLKLTEQTFEFATYAHKAFLFGDAQTKREILSTIADLNCTMKDHLLNIQAVEWLVPIKEQYPSIEAKIKAFEPEEYGTDTWNERAFAVFSPEVRERRDLNPQPPP